MAWNDNLAGPALRVASVRASPLRVRAGPGTGKTFALMRRLARLLEEGAVPEQVLLSTFTRTAATDLKPQWRPSMHQERTRSGLPQFTDCASDCLAGTRF
jgi:DNA helicase II / ATP-dependent DNA helicase PcrA